MTDNKDWTGGRDMNYEKIYIGDTVRLNGIDYMVSYYKDSYAIILTSKNETSKNETRLFSFTEDYLYLKLKNR
ncbi:hypothetical protein HPMG_01142 [Helicobacter pullorum MIT 98-5489]|uniref:Uncharacterized protein n=1 Tax=Helicobacter pullorum MIT 98-5489 TaxID=537972 RepID=C5F091_9HELI|nr:hypothetical protein [Helicobacter pullorum]EAI5592880.1 hypothetical protein [Campylobacter jejuni]HEH5010502.1 hypothetical protein [Campylobacter coli]EAL0720627.1 hypothetical protein [Campylobacter jejuni]EEQ63685.1 hypothetical protein HPMG_01142 [Helicobacter pullorum MIT 98-5489]OCR08645.1 hypothetical protein A7X13_07050 [Helicobacter pullorum]